MSGLWGTGMRGESQSSHQGTGGINRGEETTVELLQEPEKVFDPIGRIALLSHLGTSYANQLAVAERIGSDSVQGLRRSIQEVGQKALLLKDQFGITEEDFFEATFQQEGWKERITFKQEEEQ